MFVAVIFEVIEATQKRSIGQYFGMWVWNYFRYQFLPFSSLLLCVKSKVSNFWYKNYGSGENAIFWAILAKTNHYFHFGLFLIQSFINFTWDVLQWAELGLPLLLLLADVSEKRRFRVPPLNIAFTSSHAYTII